jgi:hypothetical protein
LRTDNIEIEYSGPGVSEGEEAAEKGGVPVGSFEISSIKPAPESESYEGASKR